MAKPGQLNQMITLQRATRTADGAGGFTKTWASLPTDPEVWAAVKAGGGNESFDEDRTTATSMTEFTIRNRSDISEDDRILWDGETYNIRQIMRMGSIELYLTIKAERGVST